MERLRNQATFLQCVAFFTTLAILTIGANRGAFGQQNDQTTKPISSTGEPSTVSNSDESRKPILSNREPSAGSNAALAIMTAQAPLLAAAERISNLDPKGTGLGGIRLQVDKHTLEVWWKGEPPAAVSNEIASQERNNGITVLLSSAQYSQQELTEVARDIISKAATYPGLVSAGPLVDGSGLEIGVTDTDRAASFKFPVPVHIIVRAGIVPMIGLGAVTRPVVPDGPNIPIFGKKCFWVPGYIERDMCSPARYVITECRLREDLTVTESLEAATIFLKYHRKYFGLKFGLNGVVLEAPVIPAGPLLDELKSNGLVATCTYHWADQSCTSVLVPGPNLEHICIETLTN